MKYFILIIILAFFISCGNMKYTQLTNNSEDSELFELALTHNGVTSIDLTDEKDVWDEVIALGPYASISQLEDSLNLNLRNISNHAITFDENINLLVFIKNKKSVEIVELPRNLGDFTEYYKLIQQSEAKFRRRQDGKLEFY